MLDSPVQEIKDRLPILEVLSDYLQLKKAGTNYKAVCPFHSEKTPSLMVSPSKQIWHCFGCGLGGDIFEFVKQMENVEFAEALRILANRAGVELKKPTQREAEFVAEKEILYEINKAAADYYSKVLWESSSASEALEYLRRRGLTDPTIKNWSLGWAPDDFHYLENFLSKRFDKKDIELAGLIIKSDRGGYFDRFHGRIMFPILDLHGQTVGFTGRLLREQANTGKYVNSPETPIYNKSQIIYGMFQAKTAIRKEDRAILVEGNMDVISCHQAGTQTAIASSGTAFTEEQFRILGRFTQNLIFAFDADEAGTTASRRALETALGQGLNVKIIDLGGAKDPDELVKKGIGLWQKAVDKASNFVEFFFNNLFAKIDASTVEGKRELTRELAPLIYRISEPVTRAHFVRKLSSGINVAESAVWDIINKLAVPKAAKQAQTFAKKDRKQILAEQLIGLSLLNKDNQYLKDLGEDDFEADLRQAFRDILNNPNPTPFSEKLEFLNFAALTDVSEQGLNAEDQLKLVASEYKKLILKNRMEQVAQKLVAAEKQKDKELVGRLSKEFTELSAKVKTLN